MARWDNESPMVGFWFFTFRGVLERFKSEKLIQREGAGWSITNLGGMLFAKKLDHFDQLARKAARVIVYGCV